jgi:hypothetical protein
VGVISHRGRAQRLLGAANERLAFRLVTDEPVHAVAFTPKGAWSQERKVAMWTARAASCTEARAVVGFVRQERRDAPIRYVRSKLHPVAIASSGCFSAIARQEVPALRRGKNLGFVYVNPRAANGQ